MHKWIVVLLCVLGGNHVFAQQPVPDSAAHTPLIGFKGRPKPFLTFDRTSSFVAGKAATTNEIRAGLEFKNKLRLGAGWAVLVSDVVVSKTIATQITGLDSTVRAELSLRYFTLSAEYTFYDSKRWQITAPVVLGFGSSYFRYYEYVNDRFESLKTDQGGVLLTGVSGIATYRILRWVGVSGGLGFRQLIVNNSNIRESFNSPIYLFRIRLFLGEIYKSVFPRGILGKHDPPYTNEYWD